MPTPHRTPPSVFDLLGSWRRKRGDRIPLSLDAAIRDAEEADPRVRNVALQHLGLCLLQEIGEQQPPRPIWQAAGKHPQGPAVQDLLRNAIATDAAPANRAVAAASLGQLGDPRVLGMVVAWASVPATTSADSALLDFDEDAQRYLRECAVIAMTVLGEAADAARETDEDANHTHHQVCEHLEALLRSGYPEVRYQAATGLIDVAGPQAEQALARTLEAESDPQVAAGLAEALSGMDPPSAYTCKLLRARLEDPKMPHETTFSAALGLAAARDPSAGPRLLQAVTSTQQRSLRGRALEALAVLGPQAPPAAIPVIEHLARKWLISGSTRVRCAYALARIDPQRGLPMLDALEHSRFASVREAVVDARAGLEKLDARDRS